VKSIFLEKLAKASVYHGIWGSAASWDKFKPLLEAKGFERVDAVSYKNDESFDKLETLLAVQKKVNEMLGKLLEDKIAGRKVDVVVHSMGGLVTRALCNSNEMTTLLGKPMTLSELCRDAIRKLITIDTPHEGSELADWLLLYERNRDTAGGFYDQLQMRSLSPNKKDCNDRIDAFVKGKKVKLYNIPFEVEIPKHSVVPKGGVDSLATGTVAPLTIQPGGWDDMILNGVRTHALVGRMPDLVPDLLSALATGVSLDMWWLWQQALGACDLKQSDVFGGLAKGSDGVVSGRSQQGRFDRPYSSNVGEAIDHMSVTGSGKAVEQVQELLEGKMDLFAPLGAP
jgi:pimeloyl-ACP methyl ester carboxylesterase